MSAVTLTTLARMKREGEKIAVLTAYDYSFAAALDAAGVDVALVGDSLGNVVQGQTSTVPVTLDDMVYHCRCVARGIDRALIVGDMPFMSYQVNPETALRSAGRLMQEGGAQVVKLEGGEVMAETVRFLVERGVPVCGHVGLQPQSVNQMGGYRVQGKDKDSAARIRKDALALQQAGASLIVFEAMPAVLAGEISRDLEIPTIGIGAGPDCDGQVLVLYDMLGIYPRPHPKFAKDFLSENGTVAKALKAYVDAVKGGTFPAAEHSF
ncbi:MAG: 3-methyl-2-oxobutanoate hydroxymethyltransferase [Acidiferrobacteraceae bacterium]|jgi:3-methyl-2-oxobutanoate hydroxymethyltransferase